MRLPPAASLRRREEAQSGAEAAIAPLPPPASAGRWLCVAPETKARAYPGGLNTTGQGAGSERLGEGKKHAQLSQGVERRDARTEKTFGTRRSGKEETASLGRLAEEEGERRVGGKRYCTGRRAVKAGSIKLRESQVREGRMRDYEVDSG